VLSEIRTYWRDPGYWRWLWQQRAGSRAKLAVVALVALGLGVAGYAGARGLDTSTEAATVTTKRVVTVFRKARAGGPPAVVTSAVTVTQNAKVDVLTVRRNGRTVVRRSPEETVTVHGPVRTRVVTSRGTANAVRTVTAGGTRTVTAPGATVTAPAATVTAPGTTVTAPGATVTAPGTTVTTAGPTVTVTQTVTEPARTVTDTTTEQATVTVTVSKKATPAGS
jgi:hypothetical protein